MTAVNSDDGQRERWWREWEVAALVALVVVIYFSRLTTLPLRGEEARRAMVACEILWTGDWIIPRQQGAPFLSRPPLGSYPIALLALACGECSTLATRLPTVVATLLTTILIYGYSRRFLTRAGALAAGLAYASMGQVLQLGQLAETEATFTLLVAGSLLLWHWGYVERWHPLLMWSLAYACAALGALAKGPQAPVYFVATVWLFLLVRRDWPALVSRWHLAGLGVFAVVLGAWQVPFALQLGWPAVKDVWTSDVGLRFADTSWATILGHLVSFPLEVWVCLLPGSLLLLAYLRPSFWRQLAPELKWMSFLLIAIGITCPTCWLVPGAKPRYYMPLYPCFAPLIGLVVDQLLSATPAPWLAQLWRNFVRISAVLALGSALAVLVFAAWPQLPWPNLRQTWTFAAMFSSLACLGAWILWRQVPRRDERSIRVTWLTLTAFAGLLYSGLVINVSLAGSENIAPQVARLKATLPADAKLVSFGLVDCIFTLPYGQPVPVRAAPQDWSEVPADVEYFAIDASGAKLPELPFSWRQEAVLSCDRWKRDDPQRVIIIGRRLDTAIAREPAAGATRR